MDENEKIFEEQEYNRISPIEENFDEFQTIEDH